MVPSTGCSPRRTRSGCSRGPCVCPNTSTCTFTTPICSSAGVRSRSRSGFVTSRSGDLYATSKRSVGLRRREEDDVCQQARVETCEPSCDKSQLRVGESAEEVADVRRGEEMQVSRVDLRMAAGKEAQPVLQPEAVRRRADQLPADTQHASRLVDQTLRLADVLEELADHDHVE